MMARFVEEVADCEVVGCAREAGAALELCRREQPDVIVLDLILSAEPRGAGAESGAALLPELRTCCGRAKILVFSGCLRPVWIRRLLLAGVHGLVEKMAEGEELGEALQALGAGRVYYSRFASEEIRRIVHRNGAQRASMASLTEREERVLRAVAEGLSSKEISARLGISVHTVVNHRCSLMKKTGRRGAAQLTRYAVESGALDEAAPLA
jgi:DNA-binding NarL/FixJ family response regulator